MSFRVGWKRQVARVAAALGIGMSTTFGWVSASRAEPQPAGTEAAPPGDSATTPVEQPSPWRRGPASIDLGNDVKLELTERYRFLGKEPAAKVLEHNGSFYHDNLLGLITSLEEEPPWFVVLRYDAEGYVKDDEAIDAKELLDSMREGNEEANKERKEKGFKPLTLDGWEEQPHYDKDRHHLVWALVVSDPEGKSVNYNTRILGRRGYVSLNLVTDPARLATDKPNAADLLTRVGFNGGSRYEDFDQKKDKVAEYGLAGLVMAGAGLGAAKLVKIGLLAKFWNVILAALIAGKKLVIVGIAALGALLKKWFGAKKNSEAGG